jgi:hypothetical protein
MIKTVPYRPGISNVLVKASANAVFRTKLLNNPTAVVAEMSLHPEDAEILTRIQASTLKEYARQLKIALME